MGEFVRKTMVSYKPVTGGQDDPDCSHVILALEEYRELCRERDEAKKEQRAAQIWADNEVRKAVAQGKENLKRAEETAKAALEEVGRQLAEAREDAAHQRGLNENLLRIARERANAERRLNPKKQRSGFVLLFSAEREYRYRLDNEWKSVRLWDTMLQTPYPVGLTDDQVRELVDEALLQEEEGKAGLMEMLGIEAYYSCKYEEMIRDARTARAVKGRNVMLKPKLKANFQTRYWDVQFFHTEPLGQIPEDLLRTKRPSTTS